MNLDPTTLITSGAIVIFLVQQLRRWLPTDFLPLAALVIGIGVQVVNDLARQGLLETTRGRGGGLRLLAEPETIRIGDVVRATETDFRLVECFDAATNACTLTPSCRLKHLFDDALAGYFKALDGVKKRRRPQTNRI